MDSIGDRLRKERERLGLNQSDFGELGGVKKLAQINYEKGLRFPDAEYLAAVAGVGVDVGFVVTGNRQVASTMAVREAPARYHVGKAIDTELFVRISTKLEEIGRQAGKRWSLKDLIHSSAKIYNFLVEEHDISEDKIERTLRLVVNN